MFLKYAILEWTEIRDCWEQDSRRVQICWYFYKNGFHNQKLRHFGEPQIFFSVSNSQIFFTQTGDNRRAKLRYLNSRPSSTDLMNNRAVPCDLNMSSHSDCYFGAGIYNDGICEEVGRNYNIFVTSLQATAWIFKSSTLIIQDLGVVVPSQSRVLMPSGDTASVCGVYYVLTYV